MLIPTDSHRQQNSPFEDWLRQHHTAALLALGTLAAGVLGLIAARSPQPFGYVYDFYHEGIQKLYANGRLPIASDCWQCYQPPLFAVVALPFYAAGKWLFGGPGGLTDPALRVAMALPLICGVIIAGYSYRILRLFRLRGIELVVAMALLLAFPCLVISANGLEADVVLAALMTAFIYYTLQFMQNVRHAHLLGAVRLGLLAGLACETKYSGLVAPVVIVLAAAARLRSTTSRRVHVRRTAIALAVCMAVGPWPYIDNLRRHGVVFFANGSAQQGFSLGDRTSSWTRYDFRSIRIDRLIALNRGAVRPGPLTDVPFYRSVWTTMHAMAWGDMTMFSDPSRHGFSRQPYPRKDIPPWLASIVLLLGLIPDALAVLGVIASLRHRSLWPLTICCLVTWLVYVGWFVAQESWALKTKYLLFLLPAYVLYAVMGWRWVGRKSPLAGLVVAVLLVLLAVSANLYLIAFALT